MINAVAAICEAGDIVSSQVYHVEQRHGHLSAGLDVTTSRRRAPSEINTPPLFNCEKKASLFTASHHPSGQLDFHLFLVFPPFPLLLALVCGKCEPAGGLCNSSWLGFILGELFSLSRGSFRRWCVVSFSLLWREEGTVSHEAAAGSAQLGGHRLSHNSISSDYCDFSFPS